MADQPAPPTPPDPGAPDPVTPGDGPTGGAEPAGDDAQARVAYLPIGLVFLVLGLSGLFNDSLRYGAIAFLPVGFVFLVLAVQGRSDDEDAQPSASDAGPDADPEDRRRDGRPHA